MEDCLIAEPYTPEVVTGGSAAACERVKSIVVMEDCLIAEPYTPEVVTGGSAAACERVKTVLQHERARLNLVAA